MASNRLLTRLELNRALLERQLLLARRPFTAETPARRTSCHGSTIFYSRMRTGRGSLVRSRLRGIVTKNGLVHATILVDGFVAGTWQLEQGRVVLEPFRKLDAGARRRRLPALAVLLGVGFTEAIGTSLAVIALTSAAALVAHLASGSIDWPVTASFTAAAVIGALARHAHQIASRHASSSSGSQPCSSESPHSCSPRTRADSFNPAKWTRLRSARARAEGHPGMGGRGHPSTVRNERQGCT